jgi:hypothetical protein
VPAAAELPAAVAPQTPAAAVPKPPVLPPVVPATPVVMEGMLYAAGS